MNIKPIETHYAGCRFRSRLEARWAVFFTTLGIRWEYEPQGYLIGPDHDRPYLPDFWLPSDGLWVEVKGSEDQLDVEQIVYAALPQYGLPVDPNPMIISGYQPRMLLLGPLARGVTKLADKATGEHVGYCTPTHTILSFRKGDLEQGVAWFAPGSVELASGGGTVANDGPCVFWDTRGTEWGNWLGGGASISETYDEAVAEAYRAARSARFEHGERP